MMTSEFETKIKNNEISQPTQRSFTLKKWQKGFESLKNATERDKSLFEAGKWIFGRLERIRQEVSKVLLPLPKDKIVKIHIGHINRTYNFVRLKTRIEKSSEGKTFWSEQIIQSKLTGNLFGKDLSPDAIITAVVDGAAFPLSATLLSSQDKHVKVNTDASNVLNNEQKIMLLGQYYSALEDSWREILWHGYFIETKSDVMMIRPKGTLYDEARAVSDYRRLSIFQQGVAQAMHIWQTKLPFLEKKALSRRPVININGSGKRKQISLSYDDTVDNVPPYPLIARLISQEEYLEDLSAEDLPLLPGVNIFLLLKAWEVLGSYVASLAAKFPNHDGVVAIGTLYNYAPSIARADLIDMVRRVCEIDYKKADLIVGFFTFKPDGTSDLWSSPMIQLEGKLLPLVSPILTGNLLRNIELWLKRGGVDLSKRGNLFEVHVRKEIYESIKSSSILKNSGCYTSSLKLGENNEQIDIVFYVGNRILVGEAKCSLYPTDPIEYYNIFDTFQYASEQARRKSKKVFECFSELKLKFKELSHLNQQDIQIIPFIITNTTVGVGYSINDVPIVDLFILDRFIEGTWDKFTVFDPRGAKKVGETVTFYTTESEASDYIDKYLRNPPQIDLYRSFIKVDHFSHIKFDASEVQAITSQLIVELPLPELFQESLS